METTKINKYQQGKIYMITDNAYTKKYYGSTTSTLSARMAQHRNKFNKCCSNLLFAEFGVENCKIELVEKFPCNSKEELTKKEGEYISKNECVNRCIAGRTRKEYYEEPEIKEKTKEYMKEYRTTNEQKIRNHKKLEYEKNKEYVKNRVRDYNKQNKETIKLKKKEYYEKNKILKDIPNVGELCECGGYYTIRNKLHHSKTQKHQKFIQFQETI